MYTFPEIVILEIIRNAWPFVVFAAVVIFRKQLIYFIATLTDKIRALIKLGITEKGHILDFAEGPPAGYDERINSFIKEYNADLEIEKKTSDVYRNGVLNIFLASMVLRMRLVLSALQMMDYGDNRNMRNQAKQHYDTMIDVYKSQAKIFLDIFKNDKTDVARNYLKYIENTLNVLSTSEKSDISCHMFRLAKQHGIVIP